ncbi:MAG: redox-sensing transcriptional repressor Rex [Oscillospiraceae bacterium]|nr:redox-sensing transcriptional repressor Rex [Oscillospiraceae bacterium]
MKKTSIRRATLGRLPMYLQYIRENVNTDTVSASRIAKGLGLGEVQVRKDLSMVCDAGKPKVGYETKVLKTCIESVLGTNESTPVVIIGAGRLGQALLGYNGFLEYGLKILAAFDNDPEKVNKEMFGKMIYPMEHLKDFCKENGVSIAALTVPAQEAQKATDFAVENGICAIWNFAPFRIVVPENIYVKHENLALSLAHLNISANS